MKVRSLQIVISATALLIAIIHIIKPDLKIDAITLVLIGFAIIPWLAPLIKSIELPGGWKIEYQDLERTRQKVDKVGLLSETLSDEDSKKYSFQIIAQDDPNLALAGLRIEIEKRLKRLAEQNNIGTRMQGMARVLDMLSKKGLITFQEKSVISDMIVQLNSAVHGAKVDEHAAEWAIDIGPRILKSLDDRLTKDISN